MIPVIKYAGPRLQSSLRSGGRTSTEGKNRHRAHNALVVVQVALALVLMVASGLMIRTFQALRRVDPGFDPRDLLTLRISIPGSQVRDQVAAIQLEHDIVEKIRAIPGVESAGISNVIPTEVGGSDVVYASDKTYSKVPPLRRIKFISPGLLATMGNRLVAGREFTWTDTMERRPVAMVSENLARELWQDPQNALGKEIREDLKGPWRQVIGVVNDEREDGVQSPAPATAYYPLLMNNFENSAVAARRVVYYVARSKRTGSQNLLADVQQAVWSLNSNLPLARVRTMQEVFDKSLARTSFTLVMLAIGGAMALLISVVGIYGVISYTVSQRTREIGIRMALGAQKSGLTGMFVRQALLLAAIGIGCGLAGAVAVTRVLGSLLYGVNPLDPVTYIAVTAGLVAAAVLASYLPALRASTVDPVVSLRAE